MTLPVVLPRSPASSLLPDASFQKLVSAGLSLMQKFPVLPWSTRQAPMSLLNVQSEDVFSTQKLRFQHQTKTQVLVLHLLHYVTFVNVLNLSDPGSPCYKMERIIFTTCGGGESYMSYYMLHA